jgi:arylsulfatase
MLQLGFASRGIWDMDFMRILLMATLCVASCGIGLAVGAEQRPNIVVIMADDVGYSDVGCFGGEIQTPNLDALAQAGIRFTQFYNTGRCCPTRASLLSGLYAHQAGIGHMVDSWSPKSGEAYAGELSSKAVTFAEVLKSAGYATFMTGKWHVTHKTKPESTSDRKNWPLQRGFDRFYGTIHGAGSFFDPNTLVRDNELISPFADPLYKPTLFYYTDAINHHAEQFVSEHLKVAKEKPFLLYMAHTAAHWPMQAKESDIARYSGKYDRGYEAIRSSRFARMKEMGLIDPQWKLSFAFGEWPKVKDKAWEARCMEVYAAMLDCMDQGIGRLINSLKQHDAFENTILIYLQDNGGCAEPMSRHQPYQPRPSSPPFSKLDDRYIQPDMIPKQTREGFPVRQGEGVMPGPPDTYIGYGKAWANVSNTPFREYKHWQHEGGISSPLIVHWPQGIPLSRRGALESQPCHLIDIMPTLVALSGSDYPRQFSQHAIQSMEGKSLVPAFSGDSIERISPIYWEHEGNRAIRMENWKLVMKHASDWELYDMAKDRTELVDLASEYPDRVRTMSNLWHDWANRVGVMPWPLEKK